MNFYRYVSIVFIALIAFSCFSIGCDDMQMMDVMDGGPMLPDGYLSLTSEDEDAIMPVNDRIKWGFNGEIWEKIKNGEVQTKPDGPIEWDVDTFDYWFYSHAESRIVFDFGDRHFSRLECSVLLPNYCDGEASIEVAWLANNVEVYNSGVINTDEIVGIAFDIPPRTKTLTLEVTDGGNSNRCDHFVIGNSRLTQIPSDLLPPQPDLMLSEAYLSLSSQATDAMTVINDSEEWVGSGETWEKFKGEETPPKPDGPVDWNTEIYDHWFYSHAVSSMVFDLKGQNFTYFECEALLPNPCGDVASVEFIWFANDVEIYNSGVIKSPWQTEMAFHIPVGTETLTLQVTDGGDDIGCDHYIIGNPRLYAEKPEGAVRRGMYRALPEIALTAELEPGKYRIAPDDVPTENEKIRGFHKTIGDTTMDETEVRIELRRQPRDKTATGESVIYAEWTGERFLYDEIVVEITRKLDVREEPKDRFTKTIHLYEGIALLNLTQPENLFEYEVIVSEPHIRLPSESGESIEPINERSHWSGWSDNIWGKVEGETAPPSPGGFFTHPTIDTYNRWFYSHAPSRITYDISGHNFTYFDCSVLLPNTGCGGTSAVEVIWYADNVEVYNSGLLQALDLHQIEFEIPAGTQTLTLEVTDGGNTNGCDGFVIGNSMLRFEKSQVSPHVFITPTEIRNPAAGTQFTVNIDIAEGVNVVGYEININFDPTALKYISIVNTDYLSGTFPFHPTESEGNVKYLVVFPNDPANGDGTLATVQFEVLAAKSSAITLTDVFITNAATKRLEATTAGAKVIVQ